MSDVLDPHDVYRRLSADASTRLDRLPRDRHGIYALHDHAGVIRYVGITPGDKGGFFGRIHGRHVTGSEERSHKFSHAYNTGRMYRAKEDNRPDAKLAKNLRTSFVRRHCRATFVVVPPTLHDHLRGLEIAVQALAPAGSLTWGTARAFHPLPEPSALVDALLDDLHWSAQQRLAVERQAFLQALAAGGVERMCGAKARRL